MSDRGTRLRTDRAAYETSRFSANPEIDLSRVNPQLVESVRAGAEWLPEGYRVVVTSGDRPRPRLKGSRHRGGGALDVQIVDPQGYPIANEGPVGGGELYRQLAHGIYNETLRRNPDLAPQMAWGGEFETKPGSGVADYMHFDFGGRRGRWPQQGWAVANDYRPPTAPAPVSAPTETRTAAAAPALTSPLPVGDPSTWPPTWNIPPGLGGPVPSPGPPPVPVAPLAGRAAPAGPMPPQAETPALPAPLPPPPFTPVPGGTGYSTGLRPPDPLSNFLQPPTYAATEPDAGMASGLNPRTIAAAAGQAPISTYYQPFPNLTENLYSGGAVPQAVAQQRADDTRPGGPTALSIPAARTTGGAGGPSTPNDQDWNRPEEMTTGQMMRLVAGMFAGNLRATQVDYDPGVWQKAGKQSTEFPKSAMDYSPIGKLTPAKAGQIDATVAGLPVRRAEAATATMPMIYRLFALGKSGQQVQ